jgi:tetratricopeptide (TPR) repeat protein
MSERRNDNRPAPKEKTNELINSFQRKDFVKVIKEAQILLTEFPESPIIWNVLAAAAAQKKDFDKAVFAFQKVILFQPENAKARYNLGVTLKTQGKLDDALKVYKSLIEIQPNHPLAHNNMGNIFKTKGMQKEAINAYRKAISLNPDFAEACNNLGAILRDLGKPDEAIKALNQAISLKPNYAGAYLNLGTVFRDQKLFDKSIKAINRAISLKPDYAEAYLNKGQTFYKKQRFNDAIRCFNKAISLKHNYPEAYTQKGLALGYLQQFDDASKALKKAILLDPQNPKVHNNLGMLLNNLGKPDEAIKALNQAISLKPDYAEAYLNKSMALLKNQEFKEGFELFEWRFETDAFFVKDRQSSKPLWNGQKNKTVFVWAEQGVGDEIMYSSLIPELNKICAKLIVQCDKRLISLYKRSFHNDINFCDRSSIVDETLYDFHVPVGSLPRIFRNSLRSFENTNNGYLLHNKGQTQRLRKKLLNEKKKTLIGVSWKTFSPLNDAPSRNVNLNEIAEALKSPDTQLICLQYGDVIEEINELKEKFHIDIIKVPEIDNYNDIDGLASLIMACDKVVSTTNATVHLAGALGADIHVLLPFSSRWIWGLNGSPPSWYKNVFPYRQTKNLEWELTIRSLIDNLKERVQK